MTNPSRSVVHLSMRKGEQPLSVGSGVLYEHAKGYYIATAWHNLTGRHSHSLGLLSKKGGVPDNVVVTIALILKGAASGMSMRMVFTIPLEAEESTKYLVHPTGWPRIDVAVIPIDPSAAYTSEFNTHGGQKQIGQNQMRQVAQRGGVSTDIQPIQACEGSYGRTDVLPEHLINPGDDLFVLGYPKGIADYTAEPIWKRATVATDPHAGWDGQPQFLIDCASRDGMSGAPVVAYSKTGSVRVGGMQFMGSGPSAMLHGIYVGRLIDTETAEEDRLFEAQVGVVWKRAVIDEIIDGQTFGLHSSEIVATEDVITVAVCEEWPSDGDHFRKVLSHADYEYGMVNAVMRRLNGNARPKDVHGLVRSHAEKLATMRQASEEKLR